MRLNSPSPTTAFDVSGTGDRLTVKTWPDSNPASSLQVNPEGPSER